MFCPICGKEIDDGSTFCPECNNSIEPPEGVDENMPSQAVYNRFPEDDFREEAKADKKKSIVGGTLAIIIVAVVVVACVLVLSVKKIVEQHAKTAPVSAISASIRKDLFETDSFSLEYEIKNLESGTANKTVFMVNYGAEAEDTDFYYNDGNTKYACIDGMAYDSFGKTTADNIWKNLDLAAAVVMGEDFRSKSVLDLLIASGLSEENFEVVFNENKKLLFAYFLKTDNKYIPPEYDDIQSIFTTFLIKEVSADAFTVTGADGKYTVNINTQKFLTEFLEFSAESDLLEYHYEYFGFLGNEVAAEEMIGDYAEKIPTITADIAVNADGYITSVVADIGDKYEFTANITDINSTEIDVQLGEDILAEATEATPSEEAVA